LKGDAGAAGANGANGAGVTTSAATVGECSAGGTKFTSASGTEKVCNGKNGTPGPPGAPGAAGSPGAPGPEGSPWTAGGTLPSGKTETGSWSFGTIAAGAVPGDGILHLPISFTLPLAAELDEAHVHYINPAGKEKVFNEATEEIEEIVSPACPGSAASPAANQGHLCIYTAYAVGAWPAEFPVVITKAAATEAFGGGASKAGADFMVFPVAAGNIGRGTWAVTAP
ncbi:MAG: hypothetical protein WA862_03400, partial [Solirubrobacterales bacterium]